MAGAVFLEHSHTINIKDQLPSLPWRTHVQRHLCANPRPASFLASVHDSGWMSRP